MLGYWGLGENTELPGARYRFGPVGNVQLAVNTCCVGFDGALGHDKLMGDFPIRPAKGYKMENFQLPLA